MSIILTSAVKFWNISCMLRSVFHHLQWRLLDVSGILRIGRYQYYWKIYGNKLTGIIWKKLWQHAQSWLNNNITRLVHGNSSNGQLTGTRIDTMRYVNSSPSGATQNTGRYAPDYTDWIAPRKGIQDSIRFWIQRRAFQISGTGFRIPIISRIPDSLSCIPDSKA